MLFDMDILSGNQASPKFQSVLYRRRLERVNPFWVYEFGVLCQTPGFRPRDLMVLMPGLRRDQIERGRREVVVSEEDVRRNVASVTEEDAVKFMQLGAMPSYSVALVRSKTKDEAALMGLDARTIKRARGSGRLLFVKVGEGHKG
ncbi:hypothetical protein KNJ79_05265 [Sphingopyxis indica]|uniref:hypothetical protein n=1 Tax=Sphingopyxis indica TaxID=436663 RepID=UPI002938E56F|nr:hypothetical protein [Sphingopyxis indica]WOF44342.1 hypothetical protein KNJ79_05265 [Sphingopyxis indica]